MSDKKVYLAILNITSWVGYDNTAKHVYGHLILSTKENVSVDTIADYNVKYLGENIELFRELTYDEAIELDEIDRYGMYKYKWKNGDKNTNRFDTCQQAMISAIQKYKELQLTCPFINLYEGEKYDYEPIGKTELLYYEDIYEKNR